MKYPLHYINCGDDAGMWISMAFRSADGEQHVLHVVGGDEIGAIPIGRTPLPIYFERDDQSLSCYGGADKITVRANSIQLTLNKNGRDSLELPKTVEFVVPKRLPNFAKAKKMFAQIKRCNGGEAIHV